MIPGHTPSLYLHLHQHFLSNVDDSSPSLNCLTETFRPFCLPAWISDYTPLIQDVGF